MSAAAIYRGTVRHRRFAVRGHEFRHRVSMAYVELDETGGPGALGRRFRRADYLGDPAVPVPEAVRTLVRAHTGSAPAGPIHLLTFPRRWGKSFSPVSFYYCFGAGRLEAVVAEVTSTPWAERHAYVLSGQGPVLGDEFAKRLHVSPFMGMDQRYAWRVAQPGATLSVHIESLEAGARAFDATLSLRRVARGRATSPWRVLALIYVHALALRLKGVRVQPRPEVAA